MRLLRRALIAYDTGLRVSPYRTKGITAISISVVGDVSVQRISSASSTSGQGVAGDPDSLRRAVDLERVARQGAWSGALSPLIHHWFLFLARLKPLGPLPAPLVGAIVDQVCFSPPVHSAYFAWIAFASSGFTATRAELLDDVRQKLWPAWKTGVCVWPAAICVNLIFIPPHYRVLFSNTVGLGYGMIMNWMANRKAAPVTLSTCMQPSAICMPE